MIQKTLGLMLSPSVFLGVLFKLNDIGRKPSIQSSKKTRIPLVVSGLLSEY